MIVLAFIVICKKSQYHILEVQMGCFMEKKYQELYFMHIIHMSPLPLMLKTHFYYTTIIGLAAY